MPWSIKPPWLFGQQKRVMDGTMAGSEAVQRATALIEQRLAQEEENEVWAGVWVPEAIEEIQLCCQGKEQAGRHTCGGKDRCPWAPFQS